MTDNSNDESSIIHGDIQQSMPVIGRIDEQISSSQLSLDEKAKLVLIRKDIIDQENYLQDKRIQIENLRQDRKIQQNSIRIKEFYRLVAFAAALVLTFQGIPVGFFLLGLVLCTVYDIPLEKVTSLLKVIARLFRGSN